MHKPTPLKDDYRMSIDMAGGVTMDLGCYCIAIIKAITGEDPRVVRASAQKWPEDPEIDTAMICHLELPSGATAEFECSFMAGQYSQPVTVNVVGTDGKLE